MIKEENTESHKRQPINRFNFYAPFYDFFMHLFKLYRPEIVINETSVGENDKVLDVAGGTGFIAEKMATISKDVTVIDSSIKMLKKAEKRKGVKTVLGSAHAMPFSDGEFDVAVCIDALHHIKNADSVISEIQRVTKPGGRVFIHEFETVGVAGKLLYIFEKLLVDNSEFLKPSELESKMKSAGFDGEIKFVGAIEYYFTGVKR